MNKVWEAPMYSENSIGEGSWEMLEIGFFKVFNKGGTINGKQMDEIPIASNHLPVPKVLGFCL